MKFPLPESPFPGVTLTQQQCIEFRTLAMALVTECVDEFNDHVQIHQRAINRSTWKEIKTLEGVAVYKQMATQEAQPSVATPPPGSVRDTSAESVSSYVSSSSVASSSSSSFAASAVSSLSSTPSYDVTYDWQLPKLLGVGKIVGTLDDVLYGLLAPDQEAMRINTAYLDDDSVDARVLCSMQCPTERKPFQSLSIKWIVRGQSHSVSKPRDLVLLEATGVKQLANGDRVGYWVQHSVEIAQCDELKPLGVVRSRQSWTSVFRETSNGAVELYMTLWTDPGGQLSERLAIQSAAQSLLTVWKLPSCAHHKKLAWLMRDSLVTRSALDVARAKSAKAKHCALCTKSVSAFGTLTTCELCLHKICSRCLSMRKLSYLRASGAVFTVPTGFCKNCITRGAKTSAMDISMLEYVPDARIHEPRIIETAELFNSNGSGRRDSTRSTALPSPDADTDSQVHGVSAASVHTRAVTPVVHLSTVPVGFVSDSLSGNPQAYDTEDAVPVAEPIHHSRSASASAATSADDHHRRQLWERMNQLRLQAEEAYWEAKRNTVAMQEAFES